MPRGRPKAVDPNQGDGFNQPSAPTKRRKKSRASPATPDMIPPPMQGGQPGYGQVMAGNPFEDPRAYPPYSPNSMQGPFPGPMGPQGGGRGGPGPPMHGGPQQNPYQFPGGPGPGHMNHRMPNPGQGPIGPPSNGKIYPSSASMVFNQSNPNAPPIYPCRICHKEVHDNDQAILCESGCNFWYHRMCTGLTEMAFVMLTQEVYAEWACDQCVASKTIPLVKMKS